MIIKTNGKKELEDKILEFVKQRVIEKIKGNRMKIYDPGPRPQIAIYIREIYVGVGAGSFGDASIFNSVISAMDKAQMLSLGNGVVILCEDLEFEAYTAAKKQDQNRISQ